MINLELNSIEKGSRILEIEAAVLRVMEKVNFHPKEINTELTEAKTEGGLVMVFVVKETTVEELSSLQQELGKVFTIKVLGRSKSDIFLQLEAPKDEFLRLGNRYVYQESVNSPIIPRQSTQIPSRAGFEASSLHRT